MHEPFPLTGILLLDHNSLNSGAVFLTSLSLILSSFSVSYRDSRSCDEIAAIGPDFGLPHRHEMSLTSWNDEWRRLSEFML